jgi:methionine-gamma-lyase
MKNFNPADNIQDLQYFGEFGGVNPSISDCQPTLFIGKNDVRYFR